jgi:hypothetical protein
MNSSGFRIVSIPRWKTDKRANKKDEITMKTLQLGLLAAFLILLSACSNDSTAPTAGEGAVSGTITDSYSGQAVQGVAVTMAANTGDVTGQTDASGKFTLKLSIDSIATVQLSFSRQGYRVTMITLQLKAGSTSTITVKMSSIQSVSGGSGLPQTIAFLSAKPPVLSVYGVGGEETSVLSWQVRDSLGNPVDQYHTASIAFTIVGGPGGGEYISPSPMSTNAAGLANVTFNSGTKSGACQIVATTTNGNKTITSTPVRIVITGGFPDQAHFTIAAPYFNFPTLGVANNRLPISVLVGDKYSNPAASSAVYFYTTAGVVQGTFGSAITTVDGQGSVDLISGNPAPLGQYGAAGWGDGYHYVVARTVGQNGASVRDSVLLLWTGGASISAINPATFNIGNMGSQTFAFKVADPLGHPLARGTKIAITTEIPPAVVDGALQNKVLLTFGNQGTVELPDVIVGGPGLTDFVFTLQDGSWGLDDASGTPVNVTITVTGPNAPSPVTRSITGVVH